MTPDSKSRDYGPYEGIHRMSMEIGNCSRAIANSREKLRKDYSGHTACDVPAEIDTMEKWAKRLNEIAPDLVEAIQNVRQEVCS